MLKSDFTLIAQALRREGLLLAHDAKLPSVTQLIAGPIRGSWWGHPEGKRIYALMSALDAEYLSVKLVRQKDTYVDTALLPIFLAAAEANEPWQTRGMRPEARELLRAVRAEGRLMIESKAERAASRELQARLLVSSHSEHTPSGAHATLLEDWAHWRKRTACTAKADLPGRAARAQLQAVVARWQGEGAARLMPWPRDEA